MTDKPTTAERIMSKEFPRLKRIMNDPDFYAYTRYIQAGRRPDKLVDE